MKLRCALVLPLVALFVLPAAISASATPITPSGVLATLPSPDSYGHSVMCAGTYYTANQGHRSITGVTPSGAVTTITLPAEVMPTSLVCGNTGQDLYYADYSNHWISRVDLSTGVVNAHFAAFATNWCVTLAAVDASGNIYADLASCTVSPSDHHLAKVSPAGAVDPGFADLGPGTFRFASTNGDPSGKLYFADLASDTVRKVDLATDAVTTFASVPTIPAAVAVDSNENVFSLDDNGIVTKFSSTGAVIDSEFGRATSQIDDYLVMTIDKRDNLIFDDFDLNSIALISPLKTKVILAELPSGTYPNDSAVRNNVLYTNVHGGGRRAVYKTDMTGLASHITSSAPSSATYGRPYSFAITDSGPAVTYSIENGSLPTGFSMNPASGVISSTGSTAPVGYYQFDVVAKNPWGSDVQHVTLHVLPWIY